MSDSLWPHEPQHARPPCPSPTPGVHPNPCPSSQWCHPTISSSVVPFSPCLQSFPAVLLMMWPKYWSFSFSISPSSEYSGLISFRIDWFDLLAVQGTLKSLLQHHSSKASILWHSAFLMVQLSHPYMTSGKTIALSRQTFAGKSLCFLICCLGWSQECPVGNNWRWAWRSRSQITKGLVNQVMEVKLTPKSMGATGAC